MRLALGFAYAAPMTLHVVAELVAFMGWGMSGLRAVAVVTMPAAALGAWILSGIALHELHRVRGAVAAGAAFAGLLVQAAVGALVLR